MTYNKDLEEKLATKEISLGNYEIIKIIAIRDSNNIKKDNFYYYSKATYVGPCHIYDLNFKLLFVFGVDSFLYYFQLLGDYRNNRIEEIFKD
jgi:hypothetical protein